MNILHNSWLNDNQIKNIEYLKEAKYICDTPLKDKHGNYINDSFAIFYQKQAHTQGSNWFALYERFAVCEDESEVMITNAIEVEGRIITGLKKGDEIIYSPYRHCPTYLPTTSELLCIDGGMDYTKVIGEQLPDVELVNLEVTKDGLILL